MTLRPMTSLNSNDSYAYACVARAAALLALLVLAPACGLLNPASEDTSSGGEDSPTDSGQDAVVDTAEAGSDIGFDFDAFKDVKDGDSGGGDGQSDADSKDSKDGKDGNDAADSKDTLDAVDVPDTVTNTGISCKASQPTCDGNIKTICNFQGNGYLSGGSDCGELVCNSGICEVPKVCEAGSQFCQESAAWSCSSNGEKAEKIVDCEESEVCFIDGDGAAACVPKVCVPDAPICNGNVLTICNKSGSAAKPGGIDCGKTSESCVEADGVPLCAAPKCGDGKVNQDDEECDLGADNGTLGKKCDENCKVSSGKCVVPSDCAGLGNPCVSSFLCASGKCIAIAKNAGACADGDACTIGDHCVSGVCLGLPSTCDDGKACTLDGCDKASGCTHKDINNIACEDGNDCTIGDQCGAGSCQSGINACQCQADGECSGYDDGNPCNGVMVCEQQLCVVKKDSAIACGGGVCLIASADGKTSLDAAACGEAGGVKSGALCIYGPAHSKGACDGAKHVWQSDGTCSTAKCVAALGACAPSPLPEATACDDNNACTAPDICGGGKCAGKAAACGDGNPCTDDACDAQKGCTNTPNSSPCDDGDPTSGGDKCGQGVCKGTPTEACTTDADCKSDLFGQNLCLGKLVCDQKLGKCKLDPTSVVVCDPAQSTVCAPVACDPTDGKCKASEKSFGTACDDDDACTQDDFCNAGNCVGGGTIGCNDGNVCTSDSCNPVFGCLFVANKAGCDDGQACSKGDTCKAGVCAPGANICDCSTDDACKDIGSGNLCTGAWTCNKNAGKCIFSAATAVVCGKGVCSDPKLKTLAACVSADATWKADNACQVTTCDAATGTCKAKIAGDGAQCDDGSPCLLNDLCSAGACVGKPNLCDDQNPCTDTTCNPTIAGGCLYLPGDLSGKACDDGNDCTTGDVCGDGSCKSGVKTDCDDGKPCTADACLPGKGCVHPAGSGACEDGDLCTESDACDGVLGICKGGKAKNCVDANACTDDNCDPKAGCTPTPNAKPCNNGDVCTQNDQCAVGLCKAGTATNCDDSNSCTADSCDPKLGCQYVHADGLCDDSDVCTDKDKCFKTVCTGAPIACDDFNICTQDSCDTKKGCIFTPAQGDCGSFAKCDDPGDGSSKCVFASSAHMLISEIYAGDPCSSADDFVEVHNGSQSVVDLGGYVLQTRPNASADPKDWVLVAAFEKGTTLIPGGYLLIGGGTKMASGKSPDIVASKLTINADGGQLRIYDQPHLLSHDILSWGTANATEGKAAPALLSPRALERKAQKSSTAATMMRGGSDWLAGNKYDSDDNSADFVVQLSPEPQAKGWYEPACGGACSGGKVCDLKGVGVDACVDDLSCALGCGGGQMCNVQVGGCVVSLDTKLLVSQVLIAGKNDDKARFIEVHNAGKAAVDISGYVLDLKGIEDGTTAPWDAATAQVPAGVVLAAGAYYSVTTTAFAASGGAVDHIAPFTLAASGGAVRLRDPRADVEFDRFGWGKTKSSAGPPLQVGEGLPAGLAMVRKAVSNSTGPSMAPGGSDALNGNDVDSNNDGADWLVVLTPNARSWRSGARGPACGGSCPSGTVCTFTAVNPKCADPACNGACDVGATCNPHSGNCEGSIVIGQIAVIGPALSDKGLAPTENEFVELYNPGPNTVEVGAMVLQYRPPGNGQGWQTRTQLFPDNVCVNNKKAECQAGEVCSCVGMVGSVCKKNSECKSTYIAPRSRMLIVGKNYDPALPKPDLVSTEPWAFNSEAGALRLVRSSAVPFASGDIAADKLAWGTGMSQAGFPDVMPSHTDQPTCTLRRRPWACATAKQMADPNHAAYYGGNAFRTNKPADDWLVVCPRLPRNADATPASP